MNDKLLSVVKFTGNSLKCSSCLFDVKKFVFYFYPSYVSKCIKYNVKKNVTSSKIKALFIKVTQKRGTNLNAKSNNK